jgi:hypothetical protein
MPRTGAVESDFEALVQQRPGEMFPPEDVDVPDARLGHGGAGHFVELGRNAAHAPQVSAGQEDRVFGELAVELQQLDRSGLA